MRTSGTSRRASRALRGEDGGAVVELAILLPLLVTIFFYAAFFADLGVARLKQQEAARYAAWEFTARPLSDFGGRPGADHGALFESARSEIVGEAAARYADLQGHNGAESRPEFGFGADARLSPPEKESEPIVATPVGYFRDPAERDAQLETTSAPMPGGIGGLLSAAAGLFEKGFGAALRKYQFNTESSGVSVRVGAQVENLLLPETFLDESALFSVRLVPEGLDPLTLPVNTFELQVDTWSIPDGQDVDLLSGKGNSGPKFWVQVDRMHLGPLNFLPGFSNAEQTLRPFLGSVLDAQLVSQNYIGDAASNYSEDTSPYRGGGNRLAGTGKWCYPTGNVKYANNMAPKAASCRDTLPIMTRGVGKGYADDPNYQALEMRGRYFRGSPHPQHQSGRIEIPGST